MQKPTLATKSFSSASSESVESPSFPDGPIIQRNWLAAQKGGEWRFASEHPLYSDARITGELSGEWARGPYTILNAVADFEFSVGDSLGRDLVPGAIVRLANYLDYSSPPNAEW